MKRLSLIAAGLLLIAGASQAAVTVSGDVANPGPIALPPGGRLFDVISEAVPNAEGYWLAGGLLRQSLVEEQTRLKVGVLFDLEVLQRMATLFDRPSRAALAQRIAEEVRQMPVTGRQIADLDPVAVEVGFARNIRTDDGDRLIYPKRVDEVQVLGAVTEPCHLPYQPLQEAREYGRLLDSRRCRGRLPVADPAQRRVAARRHRALESRVRAVSGGRQQDSGADKNDDLDPPLPELNQQLAEFIATQLAEVVR